MKKTCLQENQKYKLNKISFFVNNILKKYVFAFELVLPKNQISLSLHSSITPTKKVSEFVSENKAIAGINGGFYFLDTNQPLDYLVLNGQTIKPLENHKRPCIYFTQNETQIIKEPIVGITKDNESILQTGPLLLWDSQPQRDYKDFTEKAKDFDTDITKGRYPRSIFAVDDENYYFIAIEGRSLKSAGTTLDETVDFVTKQNYKHAINLDGGGSSTLIVNNKLLNTPKKKLFKIKWLFIKEPGGERKIPNAILASPLE